MVKKYPTVQLTKVTLAEYTPQNTNKMFCINIPEKANRFDT